MADIQNEETLLQDVLENGFSTERPEFPELLVLAKKMRKDEGYGEKNIVKRLSIIWQEHDEFFNPILEETILYRVARAAIKNPEFRIPKYPISFSLDELSKIRKVKNFKYQKAFFSALAVAKSAGNGKYFSDSKKTITLIGKISGENISHAEFTEDMASSAIGNKIFEFIIAGKNKQFYSILLKQVEDVVLTIKNDEEFSNAGKIYQDFVGGRLGWCEDCESEFYKNSSTHIYCEQCRKSRDKEKNRDRVAKFREKSS